jgi:hypothetical protein
MVEPSIRGVNMKKAHALFATILILASCFASFIPSQAADFTANETVTVTTIVRVTTTIQLNVTFAFQSQGTYSIPILVVNATLVATGDGLNGVIAGQVLTVSASWGRTVNCTTDGHGVCYLAFSIPPLGGANTLTALYAGTSYFAPCAVTRVV